MKKNSLKTNAIIQIILFFVLIAIDQITKILAVNLLKGKSYIPILGELAGFQYLENNGAAFGILKDKQYIFYIITAIVVLIIIYIWFRINKCLTEYNSFENKNIKTIKDRLFLNYILIVLASGAIGNLIDRVRQAFVIDFIYFKKINFAIFNFADICVTFAAIALIVYFAFIQKDDDDFRPFSKKQSSFKSNI